MKTTPKYSKRVDPESNPYAKIIEVGEALGAQELAHGTYFYESAPAGKERLKLLKAARISPAECYKTNVIKEKPPDTKTKSNDISVFISHNDKSGKTTTSPEFDAYVAELREELQSHPANIIIAYGNVPLYALTGQWGVTKRRGSIYNSTLLPGRKVISTLHPASILYSETKDFHQNNDTTGDPRPNKKFSVKADIDRMFVINDLRRAAYNADFPEIRLPKHEFHLNPSFSDVMSYVKDCQSRDILGFDIESVDTTLTCFSVSQSESLSMCVPIFHNRDYFSPPQEYEIFMALARLLESSKIEKIIQNAQFDYKFMFHRFGIITKPVFCTLVAQSVLAPGTPKDLGTLVSLYCDGLPYYKDDGKTLFKNEGAILRQLNYDYSLFWRYNCLDSTVIHTIKRAQEAVLDSTRQQIAYKEQVATLAPAVFMGTHGQLIDVANLSKANNLVAQAVDAKYIDIQNISGEPLNINSPKQMKDMFYDKLKVKPYTKQNSKGQSVATLDDKALKRIATGQQHSDKARKLAKAIIDYRRLNTLRSRYIGQNFPSDGIMRFDLNIAGTIGTRFSSDTDQFGEGQNTQNFPKDDYEIKVLSGQEPTDPKCKHKKVVNCYCTTCGDPVINYRSFVIANPGHVMFVCDLSQAELRVSAAIGPEPKLLKGFADKIDLHTLTAAEALYDKPWDQVTPKERKIGKIANYSLSYNIGINKFAMYNGLSVTEAKFVKDRWTKYYSGIPAMWRWIETEIRRSRTLYTCMLSPTDEPRRRSFIGPVDIILNEAYNFIPQVTVGRVINARAMVPVYEQFGDVCTLLAQEHDGFRFEIPISVGWKKIAETIIAIKAIVEQPLYWKQTSFVIPMDVGICKNVRETVGLTEEQLTDPNLPLILESTYNNL